MVSNVLLLAGCLLNQSAISGPAVASANTRDQLGVPAPLPAQGLLVTPELRGDIFMARKMFREAVETYKQGPEDSAVIANKTGIAYHQMLEIVVAKKYYQRAVQLNPAYAEAINNIGTVYYAQKDYGRAIKMYRRALVVTPSSASIYSNLGTAQFSRKKYKEAFESYQQALTLDPDVFEHRSSGGQLLQERAVDERAKFHFYLAKLFAKQGMNDRALLYIRKAIEEGFRERKKLREDPEFSALQALPEFQELLVLEPRVL